MNVDLYLVYFNGLPSGSDYHTQLLNIHWGTWVTLVDEIQNLEHAWTQRRFNSRDPGANVNSEALFTSKVRFTSKKGIHYSIWRIMASKWQVKTVYVRPLCD